MAEVRKVEVTSRPVGTPSPPPNCAICLGPYANKCFSDSCMHQFCFKCLLEWSKIKAECPLCKQRFKSIIHNVKSNEEYDEHIVETNIPAAYVLPTRQQFSFRTTFTVDARGEHAIQQMLLTHPLTAGGAISFPGLTLPSRRRRRVGYHASSSNFRRSIYQSNMWVNALPDVSGRYQDVSPAFFRNCPAARTRLAPWLNRELNALLYENTQLIMHLVDLIMDFLMRHHICSRAFRSLLVEYLGDDTDHFVHEFYNFMRSPFDMFGYDRHSIYSERRRSLPTYIDVSDNDSDSDVILVSPPPGEPPVTIPEPIAEPVIIDLSDDTDSDVPVVVSVEHVQNDARELVDSLYRETKMPLKLRLKQRLNNKMRYGRYRDKKRGSKRDRSSSSSSSSSSTSGTRTNASISSINSSDTAAYKRYKRKKKLKKLRNPNRKKKVQLVPTEKLTHNSDSESDDDIPLSAFAVVKRKENQVDKYSKRGSSNLNEPMPSCSRYDNDSPSLTPPLPSTSYYGQDTMMNLPSCSKYFQRPIDFKASLSYDIRPTVRSEIREVNNGCFSIKNENADSCRFPTTSALSDSSD